VSKYGGRHLGYIVSLVVPTPLMSLTYSNYHTVFLLLMNHACNCSMCPTVLIITWKVKYPLQFAANLFHSSSNQELFEKHFFIENSHYENMKIVTMKNMDNFHFEGKPIVELTPFVVSKDKWDTTEDTGRSIKMYCIYIYILQYAKMKQHRTMKNQSSGYRVTALVKSVSYLITYFVSRKFH